MNRLVKVCLVMALSVSSVISGQAQTGKEQPGKVAGEAIYTHVSGGENRYNGVEIPIKGLFNGKDMGIIGTISAQGALSLQFPEIIPDEMLSSRPGTDIKGGGLSTVPDIRLWKSDADYLIPVYVNREYTENGTSYSLGWNYATNKHLKTDSTEGYKWVLMNEKEAE